MLTITQIIPPPTKIKQYLDLNEDLLDCQERYNDALENMKSIDPLTGNFDELARAVRTQFIYLQVTAARRKEVLDTLTENDLNQIQKWTS